MLRTKPIDGIILTGGIGSRLGPFSCSRENRFPVCKPALPVGNVPIIARQMRFLHDMGVKRVFVVTKYQPETVKQAVSQTHLRDMEINYFDMNEHAVEPYGAAWTVLKLLETCDVSDSFMVLNGDIILERNVAVPFMEAFRASSAWAQILAAVTPFEDIFGRFGCMQLNDKPLKEAYWQYLKECDDEQSRARALMAYETATRERWKQLYEQAFPISRFVEKPAPDDVKAHVGNLANVGVFAFDRKVFELFSSKLGIGFADFAGNLFQGIIDESVPVQAFVAPFNYYWKDIGKPQDLLFGNLEVINWPDRFGPFGRKIKKGVWVGKKANIQRGLEDMQPPVVIGNGVEIFDGSKIGPHVVIGDGWIIGAGVKMSNSVLLPGFQPKDRIRILSGKTHLSHLIAAGGYIKESFQDGMVVVSPEGRGEEVSFFPFV